MRAVALADAQVQKKIVDSFIPLKVVIPYGTKEFPLQWEAMKYWRLAHFLMGGEKCTGLTACSVVSPDLQIEYANTGSAFVWEMFESPAYDAKKFAAMLDRALERFRQEQAIRRDPNLSEQERIERLESFRRDVQAAVLKEGATRPRPKGFTDLHALELFAISGDLFWNPEKEKQK
ncbi:MAG: hypothetical protein RMI91_13585 [Gemmatales bacterium]|nr:hypothetical protein [Gemmatales bacterium]MDW7995677.1 hypothetical protein [Gemmatales bacterium]